MRRNKLYLVRFPAMVRRTGMNVSNYKTNILLLNSYVTGIVTTSLPTFNMLPENYAEYLKFYGAAQLEAKKWVKTIYTNLIMIPGGYRRPHRDYSENIKRCADLSGADYFKSGRWVCSHDVPAGFERRAGSD